jgi:HD-GYP domain-containing protein (c-di-GMP phosphodiesterase class II)
MRRHPVDGARIIMESRDDLETAAIVAYEHHIMLDGGGYPRMKYPRPCALASRLVHVCDVYDALCTTRPYREAWSSAKAVALLRERAGVEFDPEIVETFATMLEQGHADIRVLEEDGEACAAPAAASARDHGQPVMAGARREIPADDEALTIEFD